MSVFSDLIERVRTIVFRKREEAELAEELRFHLEMSAEQAQRAGVSESEAKRLSAIELGGVERTKEDVRDARGTRWLDDFVTDIGLALRTIRRAPGVAVIVIGMLAIGIGANTAIFTLIDAVVLRSLPVREPDRLVVIGDPTMANSTGRSTGVNALSYLLYRDISALGGPLESVLAAGPTGRLDVRIDATATEFERPHGRFVSGNYFSVLGVPAFRGRVFDGTEDNAVGAAPIAVISHRYWTRRFQQHPATIGTTIVINNTRMTIVGVAPEHFSGEVVGEAADIWLPASMRDVLKPRQLWLGQRNQIWLLALGRLAPGATLEQVKATYSPFMVRTVAEYAGSRREAFLARNPQAPITAGHRGFSDVRGTFQAPLLTLMIGVALLLCIICANVANLLLARAVARGREMSVRLALGAGRGRLVRLLLAESLVLAVFGTALGVLLASWGSGALLALASDGQGIPLDLALNVRVLLFTVAISCAAVVLFGLAPAVRASRAQHASMLRDGARTIGSDLGGGRRRITPTRILIGAQVALSVVLLVGAAMLSKSLRNVQSAEVGLDRDHLLMLDLDIETRNYERARIAPITSTLVDRIAAIPGVSAVVYSENGIFSGTEWSTRIDILGQAPRSDDDRLTATDNVSPGYFSGVGARMVAGREFDAGDAQPIPRVAVVNESFAKFYFPQEIAVGKTIIRDSLAITIIGVAADLRDHYLDRVPRRRMYTPFVPTDSNFTNPEDLRIAIRTTGDPVAVATEVRNAVTAIDPTLPIHAIVPLSQLMRRSIQERRLLAQLASAFGVLALVLASVGLYGVMSYAIKRRTGELGLRAALGAQRGDVIRLVLTDALALVVAGVVVGVPLALVSTRLLGAQLHGVGRVDPASIVVALLVLTVSAAIAGLLPALSASRVSPLVALRAN
ncbi:MAG TPA: ABC transporter permease [Gemmatimonadaceae bacterium]|nr:ABC transporter permease [Gemmatimonadaceae bacterium]